MIIQFKQWKSGAHRAPHKPLLFLYALGQWQQGIKEIPWVAAQPFLTNLLNRFGVPAKKQTPENKYEPGTYTPLEIASRSGSLEIVKLLIERGASITLGTQGYHVPNGPEGDLVAGYLQTHGSKPVTRF